MARQGRSQASYEESLELSTAKLVEELVLEVLGVQANDTHAAVEGIVRNAM